MYLFTEAGFNIVFVIMLLPLVDEIIFGRMRLGQGGRRGKSEIGLLLWKRTFCPKSVICYVHGDLKDFHYES